MKAANGARRDWLDAAMLVDTDECQIVPFSVGTHGYVALTVNRQSLLAHRYVCSIAHGPANGRQAAHSCGNKKCANKKHLRWASRSENEADKLKHGTHNRGERHSLVKLSREEVFAIRAASGTQRDIANSFGVVQQTVSDIKLGRRWSWL
jgi:hypothetical protein